MGGGGGKGGGGGGDMSQLMLMNQMSQQQSLAMAQQQAATTTEMLRSINESATKMPTAPSVTPTPTPEGAGGDTGTTAADDSARKLAASKILGRTSTILTGGEGVTGDAMTKKKALLGQ